MLPSCENLHDPSTDSVLGHPNPTKTHKTNLRSRLPTARLSVQLPPPPTLTITRRKLQSSQWSVRCTYTNHIPHLRNAFFYNDLDVHRITISPNRFDPSLCRGAR
jgi:hypothetical protein